MICAYPHGLGVLPRGRNMTPPPTLPRGGSYLCDSFSRFAL